MKNVDFWRRHSEHPRLRFELDLIKGEKVDVYDDNGSIVAICAPNSKVALQPRVIEFQKNDVVTQYPATSLPTSLKNAVPWPGLENAKHGQLYVGECNVEHRLDFGGGHQGVVDYSLVCPAFQSFGRVRVYGTWRVSGCYPSLEIRAFQPL